MPTAISTTFGFFHMASFPSLQSRAERSLRRQVWACEDGESIGAKDGASCGVTMLPHATAPARCDDDRWNALIFRRCDRIRARLRTETWYHEARFNAGTAAPS